MTPDLILCLCLMAYLVGSIPFGLILSALAGVNIRAIGSGNIGATNVARSGHKGLAVATLLLDGGKGFFVVWWVQHMFYLVYPPIAVAVVLGHVYPVWLKFKGGKGVATSIGVLLALSPWLGITVCGIWLVVFSIGRISSIASLMSLSYAPIVSCLLDDYLVALIAFSLALIVVITHRDNIRRLINGMEHSFKAMP